MWGKDTEKQVYGTRVPGRRIKHLHWTVLIIFLISTFLAVVVTGVLFAHNDTKKANKNSADTAKTGVFNNNSQLLLGVEATVNLNNFDPLDGLSYTVSFETLSRTLDPQAEFPIACVFADDLLSGDLVPFLEINPSSGFFLNHTGGLNASASGFLSRYPFDEYTAEILVGATASSFISTLSSTCDQLTPEDFLTPVPFELGLGQSLPGFSASFIVLPRTLPQGNGTSLIQPNNYVLQLTVRRDRVIKFFAVVTFIMTWTLTLAVVIAAGQAIMYNTEPRFELVGASTALLFALPQIRQSQPGMPITPTISDTVGYYWAIAFLGLTTTALIVHATWQMKLERDRKLRSEQDEEVSKISLPLSGTSSDYKAPNDQIFNRLAPNRGF